VSEPLHRPVPYDELDHTADAGVRVRGASPEEALARLVLAYADLIAGAAPADESTTATIEVEPGELAEMAVNVLRELLYRFDTEGLIPESCRVDRLDPAVGTELTIGAGKYDPSRHAEGLGLKAVTWHAARFERDGDDWVAQIVFDV
jgi:SHS2 domain-containing protein